MSDFAYPLHEECGVFGIYDKAGTEDVAVAVYSALYALQHRGQESCGMAVNEDGVITGHRDLGLVNEVFTPQVMETMRKPEARMATGHVRYATAGSRVRANAQPMIVRHGRGTMALCHNGNLTNAVQLRNALENDGAIFHGSSDTEVICYLLTRNRLRHKSIEQAVSATMEQLEGAYSLIIMSSTKLIAVRDPRGYRPLCIGTLPGGGYAFASESCALDAVGAALLRDVEPGEIVVADANGLRSIKDHCSRKPSQMCVFEYIYFARPDSTIEGCSVHEARMQAGRFLAQEHPVDADVVIGVPDSGLDAALGYAEASGIPYGIGFIKNKYIGRTFIQGNQKQRENSVRIKLNVIASTVRDKRVVLIDDSIVRGTTSARIIKLLRDAGAKEVHFRVSAPPFKYPCYFGTDIPDQKLLVATGRTVDQINEIIGADTLGYLSTEHVVQLAPGAGCGFCTACFTGQYAVKPEVVLSTDIHDRPLHQRPKGEKKLGE
ncbi:MAG TPA: amidophosphoribosyltransferase [Candidatus Faecalibacterium gallistercoris]|uniref:Amidophosphoribosyltransferase n=1 Tax=Candidatus Faecalibacterium gallistercoris TaxID=2838579 RepID=A0A9D2JNC7_9FIRM|nr:amidophosphoribosyltransferase [Candidatus Faecalibacterium gallistercoris]